MIYVPHRAASPPVEVIGGVGAGARVDRHARPALQREAVREGVDVVRLIPQGPAGRLSEVLIITKGAEPEGRYFLKLWAISFFYNYPI